MTLANLNADVDLLNGFQPTKSSISLDSAEHVQHGHRSLTSTAAEVTLDGQHPIRSPTVPLKDSINNYLPAAFQSHVFGENGQRFSTSAPDLSKESTHQHHQAHSDISNGYHPAARATGPSINPTDGLPQMYSGVINGNDFTASKKTQNNKVDLGPHAKIVVQEWKLLSNTDPFIKPVPVYVDTEHLGIAKITAVSK